MGTQFSRRFKMSRSSLCCFVAGSLYIGVCLLSKKFLTEDVLIITSCFILAILININIPQRIINYQARKIKEEQDRKNAEIKKIQDEKQKEKREKQRLLDEEAEKKEKLEASNQAHETLRQRASGKIRTSGNEKPARRAGFYFILG